MKEYVGKRLLVSFNDSSAVFEVGVIEISPRGDYAHLLFVSTGEDEWRRCRDVVVKEVLPPPLEEEGVPPSVTGVASKVGDVATHFETLVAEACKIRNELTNLFRQLHGKE